MAQQRLLILPEQVTDDVDTMIDEFYFFVDRLILPQGAFSADTVTGPEVDAYCALRYQGEVCNGGHAQFFGNAVGRMYIFETALAGLTAIGAGPQRQILQEMIDWAGAASDDAQRVVYENLSQPFRPELLDRLDARFFDAQDIRSISTLAADWISRLPNLRVVSEDEHLDYLRKEGVIS